MEKYKIALISDWYFPKVGGIEYSMHTLAKTLSMHGHKVSVITRSYPGVPQYSIKDGVSVIRVKGSPLPGQQRFLTPSAYKELFSLLKNGNYEIVNPHGLDSPMGMSALLASRKLGIPVIVTNHSLVGNTPYRQLLYIAGRLLLRYADAVIAVSSAVEKDSRLMTKKPIYRIFNGIDSEDKIIKIPLPVDTKGKIVIVTVARMTKKKGVQNIIDLAPLLLEKYKNLLFLMIGDGPLREKLERIVEKSGLSNNFYFTGEISREKVLGYLEQADIFALPSTNEAFGVSILEAISRKVPVVAMNNSGVSDIIKNGINGYLADSLEEFLFYLENLIETPALRTSFAEEAIRGLSNYDWNWICEQTSKVYTSVIYEKYHNNH
ncbi:Glycosyltransferase involved in cell wall bisynthesis [Methanosarcina thermophila]|jgi:1,2-diacylglycerol 3-alpha-glucosyltransferase|uniref:Glycosyltransferase involved in cell wall bisynthesis n=3 Tax=Methanosarcina thermophila TaxID=2210 RepID=A0A1I7ATT4_METTE|nr:glycosyltransferase [Methanosarcina thermophila]ALK04433.1 MAG: N-acetylglucosaminyl-phosphatidylinositol biosynthetic protein [Methanosarcina sp. 795]AKB13060.1 Glycosyltransferase [Methanosarcina thermophila TM-1]NLU56157.1 glycosyltransferase family 4 protein [Methanosarcina thermophila]SFT78354.1 Glycosyltransferase involved in cell wall bisynthesis [Methanosarcina thermophila]BAW28044.1 N-acetylglucosaminyl-phosphatidylinositol biosynthetic protein [Methanosarcina thermophila]